MTKKHFEVIEEVFSDPYAEIQREIESEMFMRSVIDYQTND